MHYVSLIIEFLRGRPAVVFWTAALSQGFLWVALPSLFFAAPPGDVPTLLAIGREFQLGSYLGPPLSFWLAEIAFRILGLFGVYLLAQACVVTAFWAVFTLGRAIVGTRHAVLAILLMAGISVFNVSSPEFGPAVLAAPLWALALLHYWRAVGENQRGAWFFLAFDLGLLLLTSYAGLILVLLLPIFTLATQRGRDALRDVEPWIGALLFLVVIFPHSAWLFYSRDLVVAALNEGGRGALLPSGIWLLLALLLTHLGLGLLALLGSGWRLSRWERAPEIDRNPVEPSGKQFVYVFTFAPGLIAVVFALATGWLGPVERVTPLVVLSGLALILAAGDQIFIYRERIVSYCWLGLVVAPPVLAVVSIIVLPWVVPIEMSMGQPANAEGRFFADNYQRRVGKPPAFVAGDAKLAPLIAITAPGRPRVFFDWAPERSPWATAADMRAQGGILVWPANDNAGSAPARLSVNFFGLVPEVPRVFARPVQGLLPLTRLGWAAIRPQQAP